MGLDAQGQPDLVEAPLAESVRNARSFDSATGAFLAVAESISGCETAMLRLFADGRWIPLYACHGQRAEFMRAESLIESSECMCGRVARGDGDHSLFFFTDAGSFVTNDADELLARATSEQLGPIRGACMAEGFKSVAILPIRSSSSVIVGVLHLASKRKERLAAGAREALELLCTRVGDVFADSDFTEDRQEALLASITQTLLPTPPASLAGFSVGMAYRGASSPQTMGGDFYDILALGDDRIALTVGDFSGHGIEAAGMAARCRLLMHTLVAESGDPARALQGTSAKLAESLAPDRFATAACMVIDRRAGTVDVALAGHPVPVIVGEGLDPWRPAEPQVPLGVLDDVKYEVTRARFVSDDVLVAYTDGVVDARDARGSFFGHEKFAQLSGQLAKESPPTMAEDLCAASDEFSSPRVPPDDKLVLIVRHQ